MTIPVPDPQRLAALRRMKLLAAGLLVLAAIVYAVCRIVWNGKGAAGYVQAAAEASMVGGLADWFAVTALFRHPLRLPIPHTAIIPRKKDEIGEGLASFVSRYFITPEIVGERLAAARVPQRIGEWLAEPRHAHQVAEELSNAVSGMATVLRDDELRNAVATFADKRLRDLDVAPLIARVLETLRASGQHQAALTGMLRGVMRFLDDNRRVFRERLADESPEWVPEWVDDRVFNKGFTLLQSFLADVSVDDAHVLRRTYDAQLEQYIERLRTDPETAAKIEAAKIELLDRPDVRDWLGTLWTNMKAYVVSGAANPESELRRSVESLIARLGEVLRDDPTVAIKIDEALQRLAGHIITNYADDLAGVISATVERWDTEETSRKLELQVGRDLQFIRINGTVVGALAGLAIYAISQLF
ncbi:MAG TPA: DUF445 domain-containing protein [Jatrophihabitantaceae bacterium]|nr:DUF445 domain-containing protein [Jatrophihabitantaceae bacterium]